MDLAGERAAIQAAEEGAALAASFAPYEDGGIADSIQVNPHAGNYASFTAGSGHALPQEEGARPHSIGYPGQKLVNKKKRFYAIGPVQHPGNPATHFMARAAEIVGASLPKRVARYLR